MNGDDRQQVVVRADAVTLEADQPGRCELEDGPTAPPRPSHAVAVETAAETAPHWQGERMDYGLAIDEALVQNARAAMGGNVSAETSR